jgi:hypothetical protein
VPKDCRLTISIPSNEYVSITLITLDIKAFVLAALPTMFEKMLDLPLALSGNDKGSGMLLSL